MDRLRIQQDLANSLADRGSPRLTSDRMRNTAFFEVIRQEPNLSRLTASFDAFKTYESALFHVSRLTTVAGYSNRTSADAIAAAISASTFKRDSDFWTSVRSAFVSG